MDNPRASHASLVRAVIECTRGQTMRTRLDAEGRSVDVRALPAGVRYPFNYGYIEGTRVEDGEELDVFVLGPARAPGTRLDVVVLDALAFHDPRGDDPKLIACAAQDADSAPDVAGAAALVAAFLRAYKRETEPRTVGGLVGPAGAARLVEAARRRLAADA